ncbi:MAG: hypothetical protein ACI83P_001086 [Janthinobacterium sp.]|jgi:hypothetical protein
MATAASPRQYQVTMPQPQRRALIHIMIQRELSGAQRLVLQARQMVRARCHKHAYRQASRQ